MPVQHPKSRPTPEAAKAKTAALMRWFEEHGRRHLPWRNERDPYRVLVSEIMLQQTQVERVIPFYNNWLRLFPSIKALARADEHQVLSAWKGLGYYRRARSLHQIAQTVVRELGGKLPQTRDGLLALKGIGDYTAGAVLAFAHNLPEPAVDTNVRRVISRLFGGMPVIPAKAGTQKQDVAACVSAMMRHAQPRELQSALMDFGSAVCTARTPACGTCPLNQLCHAYKSGGVGVINAVKKPKAKRVPRPMLALGVLREGKAVYLRRTGGLLSVKLEKSGGRDDVARQALKRLALEKHGVEIAVRPAATVIELDGKAVSLHRCSLLYGKVGDFQPASAARLKQLEPSEQSALAALGYL